MLRVVPFYLPAARSASTAQTPSPDSGGLSTAAIVGIAAGAAIAVTVLTVLMIVFVLKSVTNPIRDPSDVDDHWHH